MEKPFKRIKVFVRFEGGFFEVVDRRHEMENFVDTRINDQSEYEQFDNTRMVERDYVILKTLDRERAERVIANVEP